MHFVTRHGTEGPYTHNNLHLKPDVSGFRSHHKTHRRHRSEGSIHLIQVNNPKRNGSIVEVENSDQIKHLLDTNYQDLNEEATHKEAEIESFEEEPHNCKVERCQRIIINVAGAKHETQLKTLERLPSTLLGDPEKRYKYWDGRRQEYFFDRYRPSFPAILYYYQSGGRLKRPVEVPVDIFLEELEFFELGSAVIDQFKISEGFLIDQEPVHLSDATCMRKVWETFERPDSSILARIIAIISVIFILASVVSFCMETLPVFQNGTCKEVNVSAENGTYIVKFYPNYLDPFFIVESFCISWFVFELVIRTISCPCKLTFVKSWINWVDLASIVPYFLFLIIFFITQTCSTNSTSGLFSVLRVLRVIRVFKLSKHSVGLKILVKTMQMSLSELTMFALFLAIGVISFGAAIYFAEAQEAGGFFTSIPDAFWWAIVSMTTVGYGDVYPIGITGKLIGSMCVLSGLLAIALPVPVIVTNFNNIYRQSTGRGMVV